MKKTMAKWQSSDNDCWSATKIAKGQIKIIIKLSKKHLKVIKNC